VFLRFSIYVTFYFYKFFRVILLTIFTFKHLANQHENIENSNDKHFLTSKNGNERDLKLFYLL